MTDPGADPKPPSRRMPWPMVIVLGLALLGAITLVQFVLGLAFTLAKLLIVIGIVAVLVIFFRGPPDRP
jgi:hypothetical protein